MHVRNKATDKKLSSYGKRGNSALRAKFESDEAYRKYMRKLGRRSWKNRPEKRSAAHKALVAARS